MVFHYTTSDPSYLCYVGKDKHENELLIKHGWDNDVWFHVDKLSSAHVYLRLKDGVTIETIPEKVLNDCMQLVKHNSIEGNKLNNVGVVYTYWSNLKKTGDMDVGQIGFHNRKAVRRSIVEKRCSATVNRLNKTKVEVNTDLAKAKAEREKELNRISREAAQKRAREERERQAKEQADKKAHSYDIIHTVDAMVSNRRFQQDYEEDFM